MREWFAALPASAQVEVRENGQRTVSLEAPSWELRGAPEKPLLHFWGDQCNVTRRVVGVAQREERRLVLSVERFGRAKPGRLEFMREDFARSPRKLSREQALERLGDVLAREFPDEQLESLTTAADLEHSLSGNYARGILRRGSSSWAVLGVAQDGSTDSVEDALTYGLLWLDRARQLRHRGAVNGLRMILPKGSARAVAHRCRALRPQLGVELYELDPILETLRPIDSRSAGNVDSWLVARREVQSLMDQGATALEPLVALEPTAITLHPAVQAREIWLRFRGLAFARWKEARVFFGISEPRTELRFASRREFEEMITALRAYRHPSARDVRHTLYRAQPERWLESMVCTDVTRIDANLDPNYVYSQVFANSGAEHGILDVLTVTRSGRLAILELKASEHIHLPLQAADYWLRVRHHLENGDFERYGFFRDVVLQPAPPLVFFVAPALHFHSTTDALLRNLSPEIEVVRVGLAESWRSGVRVVLRQ